MAALFLVMSVIHLCFQGIVRAIRDYQGPLKEHEVTIFVRRGGPNYQEGLRVMGEVGKRGGFFSLPLSFLAVQLPLLLPSALP